VFNGDFELGNTGFTTELLIPSQLYSPFGTYIIADNARDLYPGLCHCTHNGGLFMVADGSTSPTIIFQSQVNVEPNTDYEFSAEFTNVNYDPQFEDSWRSIFEFSVNGSSLGSPITVGTPCCSWTKFHKFWNSGNNTTATIKVVNLNTSSAGNDFAFDNVAFRKICKAYDTINIILIDPSTIPIEVNVRICEKEFPYTYYDSVFYGVGDYGYVFSTEGEIDSLYIISLSTYPQYDISIYDTICEGQTYIDNGFETSSSGLYTNTFSTIYGCDSLINLSLFVQPIKDSLISAIICEGDVYKRYGFNQDSTGTYCSTYSFGEKCDRNIVLTLNVIDIPEMSFFPENEIMVEDYPITLDATCIGCNSYLWNTGSFSPSIIVNGKGIYRVCAYSFCGSVCDSVFVNNPDVYIFLPNSFTPLQSSNNIFEIYTEKEKIELLSFEIFSRWGERVFETKDINKGWDGFFKGEVCNSDDFVWKILYKTKYTSDIIYEKVGVVSLIR
ncbi:MAG: gliding motility-associated C-terminal domain-containing protein, partial [Bacteroidales bacterium]